MPRPVKLPSLEEQIQKRSREITILYDGIMDLMTYLESDKFRKDSTVQVQDVLTRLRETRSRYIDV